ncbi:Uncharacterized conserved protein YurZ, alkylhydroperoxidase/carboxymuconolactone decarboxylase family [Thermosyntropha lipolytica DSM 11003]|uniref:Uncharacterized conserved protein YurZ, alkylhydroperoxidase/carboxymuconolactone decarboxylase family n=1 Tax=Thermosyntropha lipolytica DSM 11003 TaxID=1123382 RepID=A0A1M5N0X8_9FIRM|nr:carboxymuconolactone decarboxylase family protein [Thermosyntropha lipolytica]SHG83191.1 Uncharacterized conserved protein YurZ, alkylhydroperoxidase/carboxymuconolactone decarboxylase family [Thermosyntropha lipolytica DSM 11003]
MPDRLPWFVEKFSLYDEEFYRCLKEVLDKAMATSALDEKTKYLIVLALDIAKGAAEGVRVLAQKAREKGATEEEIKEVVRLAYYVSGMEVIKTSLAAFE